MWVIGMIVWFCVGAKVLFMENSAFLDEGEDKLFKLPNPFKVYHILIGIINLPLFFIFGILYVIYLFCKIFIVPICKFTWRFFNLILWERKDEHKKNEIIK
jgi:hypothetical protein